MSYNHILVAVDLTESSKIVIGKAVLLAKEVNAKLSFIYVDPHHLSTVEPRPTSLLAMPEVDDGKEKQELCALAEQLDYPVENTLVVIGDLEVKLATAVNQLDIDLLVCGHHHDFWSRLLSSVRKLANTVNTDLLVVYLEK